MSLALARSLLLTGALSRLGLLRALRVHVEKNASLLRALILEGGVDPARIEASLESWDGPRATELVPASELTRGLPPGVMEMLLAIPMRRDPRTGTIDVAFVDPNDSHAVAEMTHALQAPVRPVRVSMAVMLRALSPSPISYRPHALAAPMTHSNPSGDAGDAIPLTQRRPPSFVSSEEMDSEISEEEIVEVQILEPRKPKSAVPIPLISPSPKRAPKLPFASPSPILTALQRATTRDHVITALLEGVRAVAGRVGIFAVKREAFVGWACTSELCDRAIWLQTSVPTSYPSALATAATEGTFLGPLLLSEAHLPLIQALQSASREVAITPVKIDTRPLMLILADELGDAGLSTRRMEDLARAAGTALGRILRGPKTTVNDE